MDDKKVSVEVPESATGNIILLIGEETLVSPIEDGIAEFDLSNLPAGDYNVTAMYGGDDNYIGFEKVVPVSIESEMQVDYDNLTKYYHGPEKFAVNVTDGKGNPIANQSVPMFAADLNSFGVFLQTLKIFAKFVILALFSRFVMTSAVFYGNSGACSCCKSFNYLLQILNRILFARLYSKSEHLKHAVIYFLY